jgi:RNA polymerase sigma factor (TIGR02999 family)
MSRDVTRLLSAIERGEAGAADRLLPLVYDELRRLAARRLARESPGQTLQATALVHEAYLRLVGPGEGAHWDGRGHFFKAAAEAMRRILVERARRKGRVRHGGGLDRVDFEVAVDGIAEPTRDLVALDDALRDLARLDPASAEVVNLRYFAGLSVTEAAEVLGVSPRTVDRLWAFARAWLHQELGGE